MSWRCPLNACDGSAIIMVEGTNNDHIWCDCRPRMIAAQKTAKLASVIPSRFRDAGFERYPVTEIDQGQVAVVRAFADDIDTRLDSGFGLWLSGAVGTGKTTLAMLVCKAAVDAGRTIATYSVPHLLRVIRKTFDADVSDREIVDRLTIVDLLHLDDLGAEKSSPWVLEVIYEIVNARYEEQRSIVLTTNLTDRGELDAQFGERTVSRLIEMCQELTIEGADLRTSGAAW